MLASEFISDIRAELVEPVQGFFTDAQLLSWINKAELDYANKTRILEGISVASAVAGLQEYPLPSNWLESRAVFYNDADEDGNDHWTRLEPTDLEKMAQERPDFASTRTDLRGTPRKYWIWGRSLYIHPIPKTSGSSNLSMYFKSKPVPLTNVSNSLNTPDELIDGIKHYVLWKAWKQDKEMDFSDAEEREYLESLKAGRHWVKLKTGDRKRRIDVESSSEYGTTGEVSSNIW